VPWGLRRLLSWIKNEYGNPEVLITENGCSTSESEIEDTPRVDYFRTYINEVLKAVRLDGCNVSGYVGWALMDVFEWNRGYL
jgi:lactase-phlorizin hydrolase